MTVDQPVSPRASALRVYLITALIATVIAVVSAWGVVVFHSPDSEARPADRIAPSLMVSFASLTISVASLVVAWFSRRVAEAARIHHVLLNVLMEYRSAEMLLALRALWAFYREHGETGLVEAYEKRRQEEDEDVEKLPHKERLEALRATLHYQRRLVSHFFYFLAGLYELNIIPKKELFTHWGEGDLKIIPTILIPIEEKLAEVLGTSRKNSPTLARVSRLYEDSRVTR